LSDYRILTVVGTRPEIIKMVPVIRALEKRASVELVIVHSGQHYDSEMSQVFFDELGLRKPDVDIGVGSGTHAQQTSKMLEEFEKVIEHFDPKLVLAEGDTNTVVAASLAAIKIHVPFGHVEAGLRCYDRMMPEEINRVIADQCAQLCFAPTNKSALNLLREGIYPYRIFVTGNTVVDACLENLKKAEQSSKIMTKLDLNHKRPIVLLTLHRSENVDDVHKLQSIMEAALQLNECTIVYPVHPRAQKNIATTGLIHDLEKAEHICLTRPLGYFDFLCLLSKSLFVLTDSGGVQEEAVTLRIPCLTLRHSTERPETVSVGANIIVGTETSRILYLSRKLLNEPKTLRLMKTINNPLGDGRAGERIAEICVEACEQGLTVESPAYYETGSADYVSIEVPRGLIGKDIMFLQTDHPSVLVTNVYDSKGTPLFPRPDLKLGKKWLISLFGPLNEIEGLRKMT